jgi:DNA-binding transcriptional MerR regulator
MPVKKFPRLLGAADKAPAEDAIPTVPPLREYTIDDLARAAKTTVRNVRAYQDRKLIEPPERRGRVGIYTEAHLGRLRLINQLLTRGYTLASIQELFAGLEQGHDLRQVLGLERAISSPWSDAQPRTFSLPELVRMYGLKFSPRTLKKVIELGLLESDGLGFRAPNPKIILAGAELSKAGLPFDDLLILVEALRDNVEQVTDQIVQMVARMVDRYEGRMPPPQDVPKLANLIWQLRPLANMAVDAEVSRAFEKSANKFLGERVAQIIEKRLRGEVPEAGSTADRVPD